MVKVHFKLSDVGLVELEIETPVSFEGLLELCSKKTGVECGGVIAVIRNGRVLSMSDMIEGEEEIDVYPAVSGG